MFRENILKTLRHRLTYPNIPGPVLVTASLLLIKQFNSECREKLSYVIIALYFVMHSLFFVLNYFLISGKWRVGQWLRYYSLVWGLPMSALLGYIASLIPGYLFVIVLVFAVSPFNAIGLTTWRLLAANLVIFFLSFIGSNYLQTDFTAVFILTVILLFVWMAFYFFSFALTNYYISDQNSMIQKLLRGARKGKRDLGEEKKKSEKLLLNILPEEIATELKETGEARPVYYESVSVLFTDFCGFTLVAAKMTPDELVAELDKCFSYFDSMMDRYNLEKLKTIGDSFMCAGGIPVPNKTHPVDAVLAALEIQSFMNRMKEIKSAQNSPYWELRLGIHTGPLVAGVIGEKKFAYDVWGDTVNVASRLESAGIIGKINISRAVFDLVDDFFICEYRGNVKAKHKGEIEMFFVNGVRSELSRDDDCRTPNDAFKKRLDALRSS